MAFLRNRNGENYEILSSRLSSVKGHNDYLVRQSKTGEIIIAEAWFPKYGCWGQGRYYGAGNGALAAAKKEFQTKKNRR